MMYIVIKNVIYLVYMDGDEYWLRIRHQHWRGRLSASLLVRKMYGLLVHGGKIELNDKKSEIKTLTFDSSDHLYSECKHINTDLSSRRGIGDRQALQNMLYPVMEIMNASEMEKMRAKMQNMRKSG